MGSDLRVCDDRECKHGAEFRVDIGQRRVGLDVVDEVGGPGDVAVVADAALAGRQRRDHVLHARVVDDEVQVGERFRGRRDVVRQPVPVLRLALRGAARQRQPLVEAQVLHAEFLAFLEIRESDLLVVGAPRPGRITGIKLDAIDAEFLDLVLEVLQRVVERRVAESVTQHPLRPGHLVQHVAGLHHLVGR